MRFHDWLIDKLKSSKVVSTILEIDDTFGQISVLPYSLDGGRSRPSEEYYSEPNYQNFVHILVSSCYYASINQKSGERENRAEKKLLSYLIDGEGRNIRKSINEIIDFNKKHRHFSGHAFFGAITEMREKEKLSIVGPLHSSSFYLEDILNYYLKYISAYSSNLSSGKYESANLFFPKPITREFKQPIVDGLAYQLAYLFKDWHGKKRALSSDDADDPEAFILQKGGNSHPALIAGLINAFLEPDSEVTKDHIQARLKELRKLGASIYIWNIEEEGE